MTKPVAIEVLLARIRTILRRRSPEPEDTGRYTVQGLCLDVSSRRVTVNGEEVELARKEFDLLQCLLENRGRVMDRSALLNLVWDYSFEGTTNTVDVYVHFLRNKIDDKYGLHLIETVRGVGYVIR